MGVNNLTGFIESHPELTIRNHELHDTKLIIDASNIKHRLHQCSLNENANVFGGNLTIYAKTIKRFLTCLRSANVEPIFVCDGAKDITIHDKTKEQLERARNIFHTTQRVYQDRAGYASQVTSDNMSNVYKTIISEFGMEIHSCIFEADAEIARLSNLYEAPILSHDSDFYLMALKFGIIGFTPKHFLKNNQDPFISCNLYRRDHFVQSFPGLDEQCLPLLGVLVGNDYVPRDKFFDLINHNAEFAKISKDQWSSENHNHERILKVLYFLCNKTPEMAISQIMQTYESEEQKIYIKNYVTKNMQFYEIPTDDNQFEHAIAKIYDWATPEQVRSISDLLIRYLRYNSSDLLEILIKTSLFLRPIIDDFGVYESSRACSYAIYGVVLRLLRWSDRDDQPFSLYDRLGNEYHEHRIQPIERLNNYGLIRMNIHDILTSPLKSRLRLLLATLRNSIMRYDDGFKAYGKWLTSDNATQAYHIKMLLDYIDIMEPRDRCPERFKRAIFTTFLYYVYKEDHIYQRYGTYDFIYEINRGYLREPIYASDYCMTVIRWITRFAAVIQQFNMLNSLLDEPVPRMRVYNWFNACLMYNLTLVSAESKRALHRYEKAQLEFH